MQLNDNRKKAIINEFNQWKEKMYANKTLAERQDLGAFFTPPELSIKMLEKFNDLEGSVLDPTCGAGNLLAAAIMAGADPKEVYGIELDPEILEIARSRLEPLGVPAKNLRWGNALNPDCYENLEKDGYTFEPNNSVGCVSYIDKNGKKEFKFGMKI